jgi:hypothetical protein
MFYHALAAVPEWAPDRENHILYSGGILKNVSYQAGKVQYTTANKEGKEYLRLAFKPTKITVNGIKISLGKDPGKEGYIMKKLQDQDYVVTIHRLRMGKVIIVGSLD